MLSSSYKPFDFFLFPPHSILILKISYYFLSQPNPAHSFRLFQIAYLLPFLILSTLCLYVVLTSSFTVVLFVFNVFLLCSLVYHIGPPTYDGYVCSTKGSVVGAIFTVLLLQVGLLLSFWYFYRSKQRHWSKLAGIQDSSTHHHSPHHHHHHTSSSSSFNTSPEVIFRSVYDRLSAGGRRPILIPYPNSQTSSSTTSSAAHPGVDE